MLEVLGRPPREVAWQPKGLEEALLVSSPSFINRSLVLSTSILRIISWAASTLGSEPPIPSLTQTADHRSIIKSDTLNMLTQVGEPSRIYGVRATSGIRVAESLLPTVSAIGIMTPNGRVCRVGLRIAGTIRRPTIPTRSIRIYVHSIFSRSIMI